MKKQIKKLATSRVIVLTSEECRLYGINLGDIVDIEITKVNKQ